MMPPAALMSATAWSVPFLSCAPKAAFGPVSGPATPILIWACAVPAKAIAAPRARPSVVILFIHLSPFELLGGDPATQTTRRPLARLKRQTAQKSPGIEPVSRNCGRAPGPAQTPAPLVDPAVLRRHLGGAGRAVAEKAKDQADNRVHGIELRREQRSLEQREMDEAHREPKDQHVESHMPPGPPGRRDRPAGEPGRAAAHDDGHQHEQADIVFFVQDAAHASTSCLPPSR